MPWFGNVKSVLEMWFAGQEGGTVDRAAAARPRQPERPHVADVAGERHRHDLGLQRAGGALYPGDTAGRHPERLNGNGGCAVIDRLRRDVPGRERHDRDRGHLHRLPLLRQARHHAAVPVRLRALVHDVRVLEPEGQARPTTAAST